ncbi:MAG TPA: type I-C CRISPR-associated endonuclease Cas1c [Lacipirellulaceae bacterium]
MKQHLNTLFVTTEGAYLRKDGQAVAVRVEKATRLRIPLHNLDGIVCFGRVGCSPQLMEACAQANVTISLLSPYGGFRAAIVGFTPGNVVLRRMQYRKSDDEAASRAIAANMVAAKIANCRAVLLRASRESTQDEHKQALDVVTQRMAQMIDEARRAPNMDRLRGIEGDAANHYFSVFSRLVNLPGDEFRFVGRSRRPPMDRVNALLSFLYSMLAHDARSACEATGLDAAVGFLHRDRPGRPGLALDLMEEFRPLIVDRLVLSLINRRQVVPAGFDISASGAVMMDDKTRRLVLTAYQKRKQDAIIHPFLGEKASIGLMIHLQARLLARHIRGDLDAYPPFLWR